MLKFVDWLAGWWLDWRTDQAVKANPELSEDFGLKKFDTHDKGFEIVMTHPGVYMLADEAASFLQAHNADNYVQFDMMPRLDRGLRPIRVTVQWANGEAPATKAARLERELKALQSNPAPNNSL